jgi:hypothetical protein
VFEQPAPQVWKIVRDFNNYPVWVGGAGESRIEDAKTGDTVGAVRSVLYQERRIRQRLLALSDVERAQTYEFCGVASLPVTDFQATLRVTPIVDGDRAFVEWWATFDCDAARHDELTGALRTSFGKMARIAAHNARQFTLRVPPGARHNRRLAAFWADFPGLPRISGYLADSRGRARLLHSRAAFGIALPVAGERSPPISRMRV